MIFQTDSLKAFDLIIRLLDVILWPSTLIILLILFRKNFANALQRMSSLTADGSGISLTFDEKVADAKKLLKDIIVKSTSSKSINIDSEPYQQLRNLKKGLDKRLKDFAKVNSIEIDSSMVLHKQLNEIGAIPIQKVHYIDAVYDIINSVDKTVTQQQVNEVKKLCNNINL